MRVLILLLLASLAHATAYTSAGTGNWNNSATWTPTGIPGNGDTVTIANGHTVTIPAGYTATVGTSPADDTGTKAIQCSSGTGTGVLVVSGTLIFRGPVNQCNSTWTINGGAVVTHDSSLAAVPSSANYKWRFTGANGQTDATLSAVGSAGSRITFNIATNSGNAGGFAPYLDTGLGGNLTIKYADISDWGAPGGSGLLVKIYDQTCSTTIVRGLIIQNTTINRSGEISPGPNYGSCTIDISDVAITNPISTRAIGIGVGNGFNTAIATNGLRRVSNVFVDGATVYVAATAVNLWDLGLQFTGNFFRSGTAAGQVGLYSTGRVVAGASGSVDLNWIETRDTGSAGGSYPPGGTVTRTIVVVSDSANAHYATPKPEISSYNGWIAWNSVASAVEDDVWLIPSTSTAATPALSFTNGVVLRRPDGGASGAVFNINGSTTCTGANCPQITVNNNTWYTGDWSATTGMGVLFESNDGYAGMVDSVQSNLVHRETNGAGQVIKWSSGRAVVDDVFEAADYNWTYNVTSTPKYYSELGAWAEYNLVAPGANDQSGNPLFVEPSRTPLAYAQRWDPTITDTTGIANKYRDCYLRRANGTTSCDPRFANLADLYNWVRAGWRTRNKDTWTAGTSGTYVGGVAPMTTFGAFSHGL